ncbi:NAD(+)/NADH kinase [Candidatus Micrarchaeota archaeon]|nr:NAD(+)/NADH kinase [Candidatus Micrarchaeota archaeon]
MPKKPRTFAIVSKDKKRAAKLLKARRLSVVSRNPDMVVAFGGDGTILLSEYLFPGVPKLGVRNSKRCNTCEIRFAGKHAHELMCFSCLEAGLDAVCSGNYRIVTHPKVEVVVGRQRLVGLNEVQLHNADPRTAIRFDVLLGNQPVAKDVLGDGVLLATPFGATGYFQTLARKAFSKGFGLAFNNPVTPLKPVFLPETFSPIQIRVTRGTGWVLADNAPRKLIVRSGGKIVFRRFADDTRFVVLR